MNLVRGFKTRAERISCEFRSELGLTPWSALRGAELVAHLKIVAVTPVEIPGLPPSILHELLNGSSDKWSAFTFRDPMNRAVIIHNPKHAPSRQESDLMHEIAHIVCEHKPAKIYPAGVFPFPLRGYDQQQEDEAKWLGACLQIPREGLIWAIKRGMTNELVAQHFGASEALARWRRHTTGVDIQSARFNATFRRHR